MRPSPLFACFAVVILGLAQDVFAQSGGTSASEERWPFYAYDNGLKDVPSLDEKAALLAELGYDGIGWSPQNTSQMLAALDKHGLRMFSLYVQLTVDSTQAFIPETLITEINALKDRETMVLLMVLGTSTDEIVVPAIQKLAEICAKNGLRLVLYPHIQAYTSTEKECLRLVRLADRPNVGLSFNLCHYLAQSDPAKLEEILMQMGPLLTTISLNGAEGSGEAALFSGELIQPLGSGSFGNAEFLKTLRRAGFSGPVGLQCYNISQPARVHLSASMQTWKTISSE